MLGTNAHNLADILQISLVLLRINFLVINDVLCHDVFAEACDCPTGGLKHPRYHGNSGSLPCTIMPKHRKNLSFEHFQRKTIHCCKVLSLLLSCLLELLDQVFNEEYFTLFFLLDFSTFIYKVLIKLEVIEILLLQTTSPCAILNHFLLLFYFETLFTSDDLD